MAYTKLKKGRYWSARQMNDLWNNFLYYQTKLTNLNVSVNPLEDSSVTFNIAPNRILDKMNTVERNIQKIHAAYLKYSGGKDEPFYSLHEWKISGDNKKEEIYRWIDWSNTLDTLLP